MTSLFQMSNNYDRFSRSNEQQQKFFNSTTNNTNTSENISRIISIPSTSPSFNQKSLSLNNYSTNMSSANSPPSTSSTPIPSAGGIKLPSIKEMLPELSREQQQQQQQQQQQTQYAQRSVSPSSFVQRSVATIPSISVPRSAVTSPHLATASISNLINDTNNEEIRDSNILKTPPMKTISISNSSSNNSSPINENDISPKIIVNSPGSPGSPSSSSSSSSRFKCDKCNKSYTRKHNLISHKLSVHEKEKLFKCDTCKVKFSRASDLARHTKEQHSQLTKPFVCGGMNSDGSHWGCGRRFYRKDQLKSHLSTNKAEYKCLRRLVPAPANMIPSYSVPVMYEIDNSKYQVGAPHMHPQQQGPPPPPQQPQHPVHNPYGVPGIPQQHLSQHPHPHPHPHHQQQQQLQQLQGSLPPQHPQHPQHQPHYAPQQRQQYMHPPPPHHR